MKYKVGDKVQIKSLDWYNENKGHTNSIWCEDGEAWFFYHMSQYCGKIMTVKNVWAHSYTLEGSDSRWTDEMIEGIVEEETKPNIVEEAKAYWDSIKDAWICPEGYIFKDENGNVINATKIVLKKKKEYPKTYEECSKIAPMTWGGVNFKHYNELLSSFYKLLICRDAYWKIAGEEMGLGKPWSPSDNNKKPIHAITRYDGYIIKDESGGNDEVLEFPTEEMRDAFYENFKELIEQCKELL